TFDVLVLYNDAARTAAGGDAAAQTRIALGVSETNTAYANSGITARLRLVGAEPVAYTEAGDLSTDLTRLQSTSDGLLDAVHTRRNQLGADLVMLVVGSTAGGACGIGYVMTSLSSPFAAYAFTVAAYECISPNYTFAHELGHNMGSAHAPEDGAGQGSLYPYSFGYKNPSNLFRTVMAYNCTSGCPRVLYFSNPDVNYGGAPTGTAPQNHNALSINSAASTIANWRQAVSSGSAPTITAIGNVTIAEDSTTSAIGFTIGDAETAAASLTVSAASANPTLVPNTAGALALGGSGASRTLVVTPALNQSGSAAITVTVSDGTLTASRTFTLTVNGVNDPPTISSVTAKTTAEDTPVTVTFTVADPDTAVGSLVMQAVAADPTLVPAGGLVPGGSGSSRTLTITPGANQSGTTTITLSVSDGTTTVPTSFGLTVTAVSDPPAFAPGVPAAVSTLIGTPATFAVTVIDPDTAGPSLGLTAVTTNAALLTPGGIAITPGSATATSRTFSVTLTPVGGATGSGGVTLSASDGTATATRGITLSVSATPAAPDAPTAMTASVSGTVLSLSWTAASTGTPAASYEVSLGTTTGATTLPVRTTTATSMTVPLTAAATYYARVRAVNGYGTSAASPEASVVFSNSGPIPGVVARFGAWFNGRAVTLSWTPPTSGDPVTSYVLEAGTAPGRADLAVLPLGNALSFGVGGIGDGTYWVRLRAANSAGTGPATEDLALVMRASGGCAGLPQAPLFTGSTVAGNNVTLTWTPPLTGSAPVGYVLVVGSAPGLDDWGLVELPSPATTVSGIVASATYFVRIGARSTCGIGFLSDERAIVVGPTP
ncbi:MAG: fibronectin type III domain-containing protein, partial [Acidobacteriota bacterium]